MQQDEVFQQIEDAGVLAVLIIERADDAAPLAEALYNGGVTAMELTLRSEAALPAIRAVRQAVPKMLVGAGTVITPDQIGDVIDADASFAVSPGLNPSVVAAAQKAGLPFAPGIATPSDIEAALGLGCRTLKYFPAEHLGGIPYLKSIAAPYRHLGCKYIPLGGVSQENLAKYLAEPLIAAVGGSWLASPDLINAGDWAAIQERARVASDTVAAR